MKKPSTCCRACSTAIGFQRGILFGHSDGASIATIYAGGVQDHRVRGLVLIAPHFFTEEIGLAEIRCTKEPFVSGGVARPPQALAADVDGGSRSGVSRGSIRISKWDITEALGYIRVPILVVQGDDDQYGTLRQVETVRAMLLPQTVGCRAFATLPHRDPPRRRSDVTAGFINRLLRDHHESERPADSGVVA